MQAKWVQLLLQVPVEPHLIANQLHVIWSLDFIITATLFWSKQKPSHSFPYLKNSINMANPLTQSDFCSLSSMIFSIVHLPFWPLLLCFPILLDVAWLPNLQVASSFYPPLLLLDDSVYVPHSGIQKLNFTDELSS